jgi:demethylmenaquinone methyltransferase / 2-methoxy-6-polyprenyl-1,4-benzoquinol methylase
VTFSTRSPERLPRGDRKRATVEAMFDRIAPRYDRMNRVISLGQDVRWRRRAVATLVLQPGARVLDLACGTGDLCRELSSAGYRPVGVDLSQGMLQEASTDAPLVRADAERLPFRDATFDGVVCGFALRNFVELDAVFRACAGALRPGGRLVALDAAVPERIVLRLGNTAWFRGAVPLIGRFFGRDAEAYRYLPRSTAYLPEPQTLLRRLASAGFGTVQRSTMTGGSVQLLVGVRS